ncbi:Holliday junction branch migration protein RuvA [Microbacterium sp. YY-01]|uniref:Holliday junction branch migration protein RuvA n=1 Tax=Microbacterium sp. YY-01 TaxID=3421634 RepID=UPI003D17CD7F
MISSLRGSVLYTAPSLVVIDVGGVGFSVFVPADVAHTAHVGTTIELHTSLIVRDDALTLYGFIEREELDVFSLLLGVTGVGPKSALGVISHLSVDQIATAVTNDDEKAFRKVSGIGPKTAKLIVVQLAGKLHAAPASGTTTANPEATAQLLEALVGLGWNESVADDAARRTVAEATAKEQNSVSLLLRRALASLGTARGGDRA